jgi:N-acetyl sugar amidotransferase
MNENFIKIKVTEHPHTMLLHKQPYKICNKTVMDTSDIEITFDSSGVSNYAGKFDYYNNIYGHEDGSSTEKLNNIITNIKKDCINDEYDCIIGLSGGIDSSYLIYYAVEILKLRVLPFHVDTGWNSEIAVNNISKIVNKLKLDLHTVVLDWNEISDLQKAFFYAGVPNLDIPQDHAFSASIYKEASKFGIKYIFNGNNFQTESILPNSWGYDSTDLKHLLTIHKKFGKVELKTYPKLTMFKKFFYYPVIKKMKTIEPLHYLNYDKDEAISILQNYFDWKSYGGKHNESLYTKFFQSYYLVNKFGFDKRKAHLSSLIVANKLSRDNAIKLLKDNVLEEVEEKNEIDFFCSKLDISLSEFYNVMNSKPVLHTKYKNSQRSRSFITKNFHMLKKYFKV